METKYTRNQVPRGARADAETHDNLLVFKNTSELHATYQLRVLAYRASQEGKQLVIEVPRQCRIHGCLKNLQNQLPKVVRIKKV